MAAQTGTTPWSQRNKACRYTYIMLNIALKQFEATFTKAKSIKMKQMTFWNPTASPDLQAINAGAIATQMSKIMMASDGYNSVYEEGYDYVKTHNELVGVLTSADKTVPDLALIIDKAYQIPGE